MENLIQITATGEHRRVDVADSLKCNATEALLAGQIVYVTYSTANNRYECAKAIATDVTTLAHGFVMQPAASAEDVDVYFAGGVLAKRLTGETTPVLSAGDRVYLSDSEAGSFTAVLPTTNYAQEVGIVAEDNTNRIIFFRTTPVAP